MKTVSHVPLIVALILPTAVGNDEKKTTDQSEPAVLFEAVYKGEYFANLKGGINTHNAAAYRGLLDLTATIDTERIGFWRGGTFFICAQKGHGDSIAEDHTGDLQVLSNIDADDFTQISEYWYKHSFLEGRFECKVGKQDANADFCFSAYGADFINSSFGFCPNKPLPTFPDPGLGAVLFWEPDGLFSVRAGVYDGESNGGTSGFDTTFDGKGGSFSIIEWAVKPQFIREGILPGYWGLGFWTHSARVEEITADPGRRIFPGNQGCYLIADQSLLKENEDPDDDQGLGTFLQLSLTPGDRNEISLYYGGGLSYKGLVPDRCEDIAGIGVASARLGRGRRETGPGAHETAIELFYKAKICSRFQVQPDIQYIVNPGGGTHNALAAGLRFEISF